MAAITLNTLDTTKHLAHALAQVAGPGLTILLDGPVGAGKTTLARATIQHLMRAKTGHVEDVPSPTFTLVQTYDIGSFEIWHADLYRLTDPDELIELGLEQAFERSFCLIEWPDRLGSLAPANALTVTLTPSLTSGDDLRHAKISGTDPRKSAWIDQFSQHAA